MLPDLLGPDAGRSTCGSPAPTARRPTAHLILVSNNPYELDHPTGAAPGRGLDAGVLGLVTVMITDAAQASPVPRPAGRWARRRGSAAGG